MILSPGYMLAGSQYLIPLLALTFLLKMECQIEIDTTNTYTDGVTYLYVGTTALHVQLSFALLYLVLNKR